MMGGYPMNRRVFPESLAAARWAVVALVLAATPLAGCAASMLRPVTDFKAVAGVWDGNDTYLESQYGSETIGAVWVILEDGTYEMTTAKWAAQGTLELRGGNILFYVGWFETIGFTGYTAEAASGIASLREGQEGEGKHLISTGGQIDTHASWSRRE